MYYSLSIHLLNFGCFQVLAVMNKAAINMYVQGFVWTYNFNSLE